MTLSMPIGLIAISSEGTITDVRTVAPRRIVLVRGTAAIVEVRAGVSLPAIGDAITVMPSS